MLLILARENFKTLEKSQLCGPGGSEVLIKLFLMKKTVVECNIRIQVAHFTPNQHSPKDNLQAIEEVVPNYDHR